MSDRALSPDEASLTGDGVPPDPVLETAGLPEATAPRPSEDPEPPAALPPAPALLPAPAAEASSGERSSPLLPGDPPVLVVPPLSEEAQLPVLSRVPGSRAAGRPVETDGVGRVADAVPALRARLTPPDGERWPSALALIASRDGLDTAGAALAVALAAGGAGAGKTGKEVLLVDANPGLHLTARLRPTPRFGFADVMRGLVTLEEAVARLRAGEEVVPVLASGNPFPPHVSASPDDMRRRVVEPRGAAVAIIDCGPPVPAVLDFAGTAGVAIVLVEAAGEDEAAFRTLRQAGLTVLARLTVADVPDA